MFVEPFELVGGRKDSFFSLLLGIFKGNRSLMSDPGLAGDVRAGCSHDEIWEGKEFA